MRKVKAYLGGSRGDWRKKFKDAFPDIEFYDPFTQSQQTALMHFVREDLEAVKNTDVIFFCINYKVYTGACVEAGYAHALGKPIILIFLLKSYIDPLLLGVSRKVFTDVDSAIEWYKHSTKVKTVVPKETKAFNLNEYLAGVGKHE